ncbi:uncharacterized protein LOC124816529 isoform X4 [Hydra vulgaris]|uniref:uncharacterized protein LOC124816529 isoform X4 n=1 Tax=Hydra vulgaris TaxID=6087 RepID=UPI0032EA704D
MTSEYQRKYRKVVKEMGSFSNAEEVVKQDNIEMLRDIDYNEDDFETNNLSSVTSSSESEGDVGSDSSNEESLRNDLADLAFTSKMTHVQVNGVLSVLRKHGFDVPKDSRTLVKSTRTIVTYKKCGGDYLYFGLRKIITQSLEIDDSNEILNLKVNVDGIPLYKSSSLQFWPILCSINNSTPMIAALFSGNSKPNSVDDFCKILFMRLRNSKSMDLVIMKKLIPFYCRHLYVIHRLELF